MEVRPIDANALNKQLKELLRDFDKSPTKQYVVRTILSMLGDITQTPTLDYEPVVHCKDCVHWNKEKLFGGSNTTISYKCEWFSSYQDLTGGIYTHENDFCSYGAKMDEGQK